MHVTTPGESYPASINRYLLPHEHHVITVRYHPAILLGSTSVVIAGLVAAVVLSITSHLSRDALDIIWVLWGLLLLRLIWKAVNWSINYYVVTSERMLVIKGLLTRDLAMIPLSRIAGMRLWRSAMGSLLGYGQFILESAGQDQALRNVHFLPYPEQLYIEVCSMLFARTPEEDTYEKDQGHG